jgi:alpha-tubulin suppressor-like RCC1 family protein
MSSFYVDSRGRVFGTGDGSFGQLGNGFTPSQSGGFVQGTGVSNAIEVATSGRFALVRSVNGYVYGTGYNFSGMLGVNGTQNRSTFVRATGVSNVIAVACGDFHSLALRADGAVFSSGASSYGQNARGIAGDTSTFAQAIGISACVAIVATSNTS